MIKNITPCILLCSLGLAAAAQPGIYSLANIPEPVKNKASVIVNSENIDLEIESINKATYKVDRIFTVVDEEAKGALIFNEYSSKDMSLEDAEIRVYDANGKQTAKYKKKDMRTTATGEGLIDDGNITYYYVATANYPITVEYKYEIRMSGTLNIPDYDLIRPKEGVMKSDFTVHVPPDLGFRYKLKNTSVQPQVSDEGKYKVYRWSVSNLAAPEYEEGAAKGGGGYPHVLFAVDKFSYYGIEGSLSSWKDFGSWIGTLYTGLDNLPPDRQQFFAALVKDASSEKEKIGRIYDYLQKNFRYVSIQLGIGGLKPFPAEFTDQKKYGDCKGLSNYMKAALKAVGIKSYVGIINAEYNDEPADPDFPANCFNHVILCVPGQKDSVWLECTSSTTDFNELGSFTENRYALLITDEGGALVPTPRSRPEANYLGTKTTVQISDDLSALSKTVFTAKGEYREMMTAILKEKKDDQKRAIVLYYGFKQPDDFELKEAKSQNGLQSVLEMAISKVPEFTAGDKLFIGQRIYKVWPKALPKAENRKLDFYFPFPFEKVDTTVYILPPGSKPDALLNENELKCNYASFKTHSWYSEADSSVYSVAEFVLKQHRIPAADYPAVKKFFDDLMQADSQKLVIRKPEAQKKAF